MVTTEPSALWPMTLASRPCGVVCPTPAAMMSPVLRALLPGNLITVCPLLRCLATVIFFAATGLVFFGTTVRYLTATVAPLAAVTFAERLRAVG